MAAAQVPLYSGQGHKLFPDTDMQKLSGDSRQRLIQEFAEKHADLRERARRFPIEEARTVAERMSCPLQIATVACLINTDGLATIHEAVELLSNELQRRALVGEEVPNIPGSILEFALDEGRWLEYVRGPFTREMTIKIREVANMEGSADERYLTVEQALSILATRVKVTDAFVLPVVETWLKDHLKSNGEDAILAFGPPLTGWGRNTVSGKAGQVKRRCQATFRMISAALAKASDSATTDSAAKRVDSIVSGLDSSFRTMPAVALSHIIVQLIPRPSGRGDKAPFVDIGSASMRGSKTEPDMESPFDFLERDVRLAARRDQEDRAAYLEERISRVIRVLKYQGADLIDCVGRSIQEIFERMQITGVPLEEILEVARRDLETASLDQSDGVAVRVIRDFLEEYVYRG